MSPKPDDRELEQYLKGDGELSRRYRDASREQPPQDVDEAVLALARAEARRKPSLNRLLAPVALAASVVLAVNLAWNLSKQEAPISAPQELDQLGKEDFAPAAAPEPPAVSETLAEAPGRAAPATPLVAANRREAPRRDAETVASDAGYGASGIAAAYESKDEAVATRSAAAQERSERMELAADKPQQQTLAAAPASAPPESRSVPVEQARGETGEPGLAEQAKINLLLDYLGRLKGAKFIRNGTEHGTEEAVSHLRMKLEVAGERVKTAADFITHCASRSSVSGQPYQIRFADGSVRNVDDVLREQLREIEAAR